jgi:hypothetical protein
MPQSRGGGTCAIGLGGLVVLGFASLCVADDAKGGLRFVQFELGVNSQPQFMPSSDCPCLPKCSSVYALAEAWL